MSAVHVAGTHPWHETLLGHALAYGILGRLFYEEPSADLVAELRAGVYDGEWVIDGGDVTVGRGLALLAEQLTDWSEEQVAELRYDYHRLFVGPGRLLAPPWESVYLSAEHLLFEAETRAVRSFYRRYGLQAPNLGHEPDDHLGLELAFMLHLCVLALDALEHEDHDTFDGLLEAQRSFLGKHLLQWAPMCLNRVLEHAESDFYRGAAYLALGTLEGAADALGITGFEALQDAG